MYHWTNMSDLMNNGITSVLFVVIFISATFHPVFLLNVAQVFNRSLVFRGGFLLAAPAEEQGEEGSKLAAVRGLPASNSGSYSILAQLNVSM